MNPRPRASLLTLALLALPALATRAEAQAATFYARSFPLAPVVKRGLSVWPEGPNGKGLLPTVFIGPTWDLSERSIDAFGELQIGGGSVLGYSIPERNLGRTGFQIRYAGKGKVGFSLEPYYTGGAMDLDYNAVVTVSGLPAALTPTRTYKLTVKYAPSRSSHFTTISPGFGLGVASSYDVDGYALGTGWFLGDKVYDGAFVALPRVPLAAQIFAPTDLVNGTVDGLNKLINGISAINPVPVGVSLSVPDLSVTGETIDAKTGTLSGSRFSTFLAADTNLLDWALATIPGSKGVLAGLAFNGTKRLPGTGADVGWSFAKLYANMNVGLGSNYAIVPDVRTKLAITAIDATGKESPVTVTALGNDEFQFTMPNARIRLQPGVEGSLNLVSTLGVGITGEIGTSPAKFTLDGSIGTGDRAKTYHLDVDPAHAAVTIDPGAVANAKRAVKNLGSVSQTFAGFSLAPANTTDYSPYLVPEGLDANNVIENAPVTVEAFSQDADVEQSAVRTVSLYPQGSYTLLAGSSRATAVVIPTTGRDTDVVIRPKNVYLYNQGTGKLSVEFDSKTLEPGHYILLVNLSRSGASTTYRIPLNVKYRKAILSGQFYRDDNPVRTVNRITADGTDKSIQVFATGFYHDSEVVMNGNVVLPCELGPNDPNLILNGQAVRFYVPADVAKRFAGTLNTIQIRTPDIEKGENGFVLSDPKPLYIVAKAPTLRGIRYQNVANATLPLANEDVTFEVVGANFSQATDLYAKFDYAGQTTTVSIPTEYATPTSLRATLGAGTLNTILVKAKTNAMTIYAVTPKADVPGDSSNDPTTSGGSSGEIAVKIARRKPTITRFEPGILVKDAGDQKVRLYGDNLIVPGLFDANPFAALGAIGVSYGDGTPGTLVPYVDLVFPANHAFVTGTGPHPVTVTYRDAVSLPNSLSTEYGVPTISETTAFRVVMGTSFGTMTLVGAPFYRGNTSLTINGNNVIATVVNTSTLTALVSTNYPGTSATVRLKNPMPGGGLSKEVKVALVEGDASKVKAVPGPVVFDRASGLYKQSFSVTYSGTRDISAGVRLVFDNVPGLTLLNASGTTSATNGKSFLNAFPVAGRAVTTVAVWKKSSAGLTTPSATIAFPY